MDETGERLLQLVEINRALARDLDASQRAAEDMQRQRDALERQLESLRDEVRSYAALDVSGELKRDIDKMRREFSRSRGDLAQIREERDSMWREVQEARARAALAEENGRALALRLREIEQERDQLRGELEESFLAMEEIRRRLVMSMEERPSRDGSDRYWEPRPGAAS